MTVLTPRLVLVTRETEYAALLARHATRGQADAFLRRRAQSITTLDTQRDTLGAMLATIRAAVPKGWRIAAVRREELDRFLFAPEDVVVAVGSDGLVANLAKYLDGQPVIGVNADPGRNAGILVPHAADDVAALLPLAAAGKLRTEARTMLRAELDDGQAILALNEIFIGHASHQSARYSLTWRGQEELQSSSGLIVATGTGATGWALSISRATGTALTVAPDEPAGQFLVREPWPSRATGARIVTGRLGPIDTLLVASRMNDGGVVFADGIEHDRLDFAWGRTLTVSVAQRQLRFVPGRHAPPLARPPQPPRPAHVTTRRTAAAPPRPVAVPPAPSRARQKRRNARIMLLVALGLIASLVYTCSTVAHAETCRFEGATSHDGRLAVTTTVSETSGTLTVDATLVLTVSVFLTDLDYRSEELTTWRHGQLETAAVNNRTIVDGRISRQQWDVFTRTPAGLQARRVQARSLPEFQDKHAAFARHWPLAGFGLPWLPDYAAARPAPRPDLALSTAPSNLRTPLALAFYWSRFLPAEGGTTPVFLPGFKRDARTDLRFAPASAGPGWQRWLVPLRHPALDPIRPSAIAAWVSPDHYLLQLAADLHAEAGAGTAMVRTLGCQGVQVPPE